MPEQVDRALWEFTRESDKESDVMQGEAGMCHTAVIPTANKNELTFSGVSANTLNTSLIYGHCSLTIHCCIWTTKWAQEKIVTVTMMMVMVSILLMGQLRQEKGMLSNLSKSHCWYHRVKRRGISSWYKKELSVISKPLYQLANLHYLCFLLKIFPFFQLKCLTKQQSDFCRG